MDLKCSLSRPSLVEAVLVDGGDLVTCAVEDLEVAAFYPVLAVDRSVDHAVGDEVMPGLAEHDSLRDLADGSPLAVLDDRPVSVDLEAARDP